MFNKVQLCSIKIICGSAVLLGKSPQCNRKPFYLGQQANAITGVIKRKNIRNNQRIPVIAWCKGHFSLKRESNSDACDCQ